MKSLTKIILPLLAVLMLLHTPPAMPVFAAGASTDVIIQMTAPVDPDNPNPDQPNPDQPNPDQPNPDQPNPDQPNRPNGSGSSENGSDQNGNASQNTLLTHLVNTGIASNPSLWTGLVVASTGLLLLGLFLMKRSKDPSEE